MDCYELNEGVIARSLKVYKEKGNEAVIDVLLVNLLSFEACCRFVDPQGRNTRRASLQAWKTLAGEPLVLTSSQILESSDDFFEKVVTLVKKSSKLPARQPALLMAVLEHYSIFHDWPTKSFAAMSADYKYPNFCEARQTPSEVCKKLWKQLFLDWLPSGSAGRPEKS
jgi:hypothetical protein